MITEPPCMGHSSIHGAEGSHAPSRRAVPGASAAPPNPGGAAEEEDGEDRKIFVDPVVFLEGIVADRTLRKALHPSARILTMLMPWRSSPRGNGKVR